MDMSGLSFDQAPPYHSVQRFFLTAPLFGILAGLAVLLNGQGVFWSFLNPKLAGITHLMTLGFFTMTMFGAMMQMLPVIAGVKIYRPVLFSNIVYIALLCGALLFGWSFFSGQFELFPGALVLVFSALTFFCIRILGTLFSVKNYTPTVKAMVLAVFSLIVVLGLGITMAAWKLHWVGNLAADILSVHIAWAFGGWITMLIMGVSFQVIPMFYVAPDFPLWIRKYFPPLLFSLLLLYSFFSLTDLPNGWVLKKSARLLMYGVFLVYSLQTLALIRRRKRRLPDPSLLFWNTAMFFLAAFSLICVYIEFYNGIYLVQWILISGIIFAFGFVNSMINGMLYKIVPFLSWFHLASRGIFAAPTMKDMLPDIFVRGHFYFYWFFLPSVIAAAFFPRDCTFYAGLFLALSNIFLWVNLIRVVFKYRTINKLHPVSPLKTG